MEYVKKAMKFKYEDLIDNLDPGLVIPSLYSKQTITTAEKQQLERMYERKGAIAQCGMLLDLVMTKPDEELQSFLDILKEKHEAAYTVIELTAKDIQSGGIIVKDESSDQHKGLNLGNMELSLLDVNDKHVQVKWKQGSFFGFGGDWSEVYQHCIYRNENGLTFPVFVHSEMGTPKVIGKSRYLQYGMNNNNVFLVYHNKDKYKPYQHRFIRDSLQESVYTGNALLKQQFNIDIDMTAYVGEHLKDV